MFECKIYKPNHSTKNTEILFATIFKRCGTCILQQHTFPCAIWIREHRMQCLCAKYFESVTNLLIHFMFYIHSRIQNHDDNIFPTAPCVHLQLKKSAALARDGIYIKFCCCSRPFARLWFHTHSLIHSFVTFSWHFFYTLDVLSTQIRKSKAQLN